MHLAVQENPVALEGGRQESSDAEATFKDFLYAAPKYFATDGVAQPLLGSAVGPTLRGEHPIRQFWLQSCGDINPGGMAPSDGVALTMHSVTRQALRDTSDEVPSAKGPVRALHVPPGDMSGTFRSREK